MKKTRISFDVKLDKNKVPEKIQWSAPDGGINSEESKAVFLSVWNHNKQETLKIDLWTKDMPLDQMNVFFHQTLVSMSETFFKATQNEKMTDAFKQFCEYFAENLQLQSPVKKPRG
jgi:gliding motility-associated protein GldC|tara:strand:+ start:16486 stop:16833 length:348 start_codon:yes stop_codon:yes gene_type:complete